MATFNRQWDDYSPDEQAALDLTGRQIGTMSVVTRFTNERGYDDYVVDCSCGQRKIKSGLNLRSGKTQSCGNDCPYRRPRGRKRA